MRALPSGTVTFMFTDIEGSTRLLRAVGPAYREALADHRRAVREAVARQHGVEVDTQGDAFFVAFLSAADAAAAALEAQAALETAPIRVRMGLHTGEAEVTDEGYVGLDVHKGARVAASGHGGQVVISAEARAGLDDAIPVTDLGEHRLKDFDEPVHLFQLGDAVFPPLKTISNTNLPRPASSFVGRRREIEELAALLRDGTRLLTLTGPGGSGKTRLAIEAAAELVPDFKAGVFWTELAPLRDPRLVLETVGQSLGAKGPLAEHVADREMLLVIDNFEHLVEVAPDLARLVEACPNLGVLVTSRELLRVRGEVEYPVLPLADPEAVQLFCARAGLEPTDEIAELCHRLDNLPLAVELAAARTKVMTPSQILDRLANRLDMFKGGRDADPRQATLRATVEWSHDLLTPEEQRLFARLAVFVGGCTLEAAEAVCDADLDALQSLVEKSLVRHSGGRFWMLETIREFTSERFAASDDAAGVERRFFEHFTALAISANLSPDAEGPQRHDLIEPEQDNLRAAMDGAMARRDVEDAARLIIPLEDFAIMHNPFDATRRVEALLPVAGRLEPAMRARLFRELGGARHMTGDSEGGRRAYQRSLELFREIGDEAGICEGLHRLASSEVAMGNLDVARPLLERSLALAQRMGSPRLQAVNLGLLGDVDCLEKNYDEGLQLLERSASMAREIGFVWWEGVMVAMLTEFLLEVGRFDDAEPWGRRSLELLRKAGDRQNMVYGVATMAWAAAATGRSERAGLLWGAIEAEEARGAVGAWDAEREKYAAAARRDSSDAFEEGRREGHRLSLEDAVATALREN
jgi:predicted ATPase